MSPANDEIDSDARQRIGATRARLAADFQIDSMFVGVPKLSRILGIAPSTINGQIRAGVFFIPYRKFGTMSVVSLDDLAEWYCSSEGVVPAAVLGASLPPRPKAELVQEPTEDDLVEEALRQVKARKRMRELRDNAVLTPMKSGRLG